MHSSHAAVFHGIAGQVALQEFPLPALRVGEMLVRVLGCTLCGSDLHTYAGHRKVPVPTVLGHEIVGEIVAADRSAVTHDLVGQPLSAGDRITWALVAHCGHCYYCTRQLPQKCLQGVKYGHEPLRPGRELLGGLADYCLLVPGTAIVRLPASMPLEVACPASCATATIAAALEAAGNLSDRHICILGAGMLGLTACAMARTRGAALVACIDPVDTRRDTAQRFGATHVAAPETLTQLVSDLPHQQGFDVVLELSGSTAACHAAWPCLRMGGKLVLVGSVFPGPPVSIAPDQIVRRQLTIQGIHNYAPHHLVAAVDFLANSHSDYPFASLVSRWLPLSQIHAAFVVSGQSQAIRVGVRPGEA